MMLILCAVMLTMVLGLVLLYSSPWWVDGEVGIKVGNIGAGLVVAAYCAGLLASLVWIGSKLI
jgi:hypothetical protein